MPIACIIQCPLFPSYNAYSMFWGMQNYKLDSELARLSTYGAQEIVKL